MRKKTVKLGGDSVMVFGMFSYQGTTSLICLNTQVNAIIQWFSKVFATFLPFRTWVPSFPPSKKNTSLIKVKNFLFFIQICDPNSSYPRKFKN